MQSLAQYLGLLDAGAGVYVQDEASPAIETLTGKDFAEAVLKSVDFRRYIINGLALGTIPSAVLCRVMDYGWGKAPDRVEHTGKDGNPIETITEVRRTIVYVDQRAQGDEAKDDAASVH